MLLEGMGWWERGSPITEFAKDPRTSLKPPPPKKKMSVALYSDASVLLKALHVYLIADQTTKCDLRVHNEI